MRALGAYAVWAALAVAALAIVRAQGRRPAAWQSPALATVAAASVFAFAVVSWGRATPLGDFNKAYYPAGAMILSDPSRLYECDVSNLCFVNLPLVALLFTPLTMMARLPAQLVFTAIGAVAVAAAAWLTIRELDARGADRSAIVAAFALNGPLLYSIRLGNLTHVLLPCLAIAIASLAGGREARAGVLFAVLTVIKPPFLLFLPYLVLRRRTRAAVAFAATVTLVVTASIALFGPELHRLWLATFIGPFAARPVAAYNVQSISGLVAHFTMPGHLTDWTPLEAPAMFNAARYVLLLAVTAIAAIALFARGAPRDPTAHRLEATARRYSHAPGQPAHLEPLLRIRCPGAGRLCCGAHTCPRRLADDRAAGGGARVPARCLAPAVRADPGRTRRARVDFALHAGRYPAARLLVCVAPGAGPRSRDVHARRFQSQAAASLILLTSDAHVGSRRRARRDRPIRCPIDWDSELLTWLAPHRHTGAITPGSSASCARCPTRSCETRPAWSSAARP